MFQLETHDTSDLFEFNFSHVTESLQNVTESLNPINRLWWTRRKIVAKLTGFVLLMLLMPTTFEPRPFYDWLCFPPKLWHYFILI